MGLDIGTTFSAAAVASGGRVEIVSLGNHTAAIPSLLFLKDDGTFLVGEAAGRRAWPSPSDSLVISSAALAIPLPCSSVGRHGRPTP